MAEKKIISGEQLEKHNTGVVIGSEDVIQKLKDVPQSEGTLKERITKSTKNGGLQNLPDGFDDIDGDWKVINGSNPFEILYLDYRQYKFITPEIVKGNYTLLESFWKEKMGLMNTGGNRVAFKNKFGDGTIDLSLTKIKRAYEKISSLTGIEQYYQEINSERLIKGEESLKETIDDMLLDGIADKDEIQTRLERGLKHDLSNEETAIILKKYIDSRDFKPYGTVVGNTLVSQLLSVNWMTQAQIDKAEKLKRDQELLKIQIIPGKYATTIEEIGTILFEEPIEAKEIIKEDLLKQVIAQKDMVLAREIGKISKDKKNIETSYLSIIYKLNHALPYRFAGNKLLKNIEDLCKTIFENDQTLKAGKEEFKNGYIEIWLRETNKNAYENFIKIRDTADNLELAFLEFLHSFNTSLPYRFAGKYLVKTPVDLCEQINKNKENWDAGKKELFNSAFLIWLKTSGNAAILEKWNKIKNQFKGNENLGLEEFLHLLNNKLGFPKLKVDKSSILFPKIQVGGIVNAELAFVNQTRGYTEGKLGFSKLLEGVSMSSEKISFNGAEGNNNNQVTLTIDSSVLQKGVGYETIIQIFTTSDQKIEIPVSFKVVFPKNAFILETLKYAALIAVFLGLIRLIISSSNPDWLKTNFKFFLDWDSTYGYHGAFSTFGWAFFLFITFTLGGGYFLIRYLTSKRQLLSKKAK